MIVPNLFFLNVFSLKEERPHALWFWRMLLKYFITFALAALIFCYGVSADALVLTQVRKEVLPLLEFAVKLGSW